MEVAQNVGAEAPATAPATADTPAAPVADNPESAGPSIDDELSAVWDKTQTGNERADDGKFVSKNPANGEQSNGPADPPAKTADGATVDPATQPVIPPAHLTAEQKAKFATLPREAQESFVEIEKAREAVYTRKDQEAAEFRRSADPLLQAVKPFEEYLRQISPLIGQTPDRMIAGLLGVEYQLRTGTQEQKRQALSQILQTYQIDLASEQGQYAPDPRLAQLEQQVNQLTHRLTESQRQEETKQVSAVEAQVLEFKKDKPFFEQVEAEMLGLVPILKQRHPESTPKEILAKAYDAAIHANPDIRTQILAEQRKADEAKRQEDATKRAEDARKSGKVNVRSGTAQPTPKTMEEEIEALGSRLYG